MEEQPLTDGGGVDKLLEGVNFFFPKNFRNVYFRCCSRYKGA
ncbi:hypothetical protein NEIPOLOT_01438 [Neisseria polysaccharea ATCC 43768]|nr:hypothetical protein NEIPOLOT_01438 [Neisseria polysaccharea ATCC 43768]